MTISATTQGLRPGVCTSTSRPSTPFDGMMIYETDTNLVLIWNGTAWRTLAYSDYTNGTILRVVSTTKTDTYSQAGSRTFSNITGLSASITPLSNTHKVLIVANVNVAGNNGGSWLRITGGNTDSYRGDAGGSRSRVAVQTSPNQQNVSLLYLDSPASTSAITYQVQLANADNVTTTVVNREATDTDTAAVARSASTITLMEVVA